MPVSLHKKKEPVTIHDWIKENYSTIILILFIVQVFGLYWIGSTLAYVGV